MSNFKLKVTPKSEIIENLISHNIKTIEDAFYDLTVYGIVCFCLDGKELKVITKDIINETLEKVE